jgi:hypothetical protein
MIYLEEREMKQTGFLYLDIGLEGIAHLLIMKKQDQLIIYLMGNKKEQAGDGEQERWITFLWRYHDHGFWRAGRRMVLRQCHVCKKAEQQWPRYGASGLLNQLA